MGEGAAPRMHWATGIAVYVTVWWTVLFAVLPFGVRRDESGPPGAEKGVPENPRLWARIGATTAISAVIWLAIYALVEGRFLSFRDL